MLAADSSSLPSLLVNRFHRGLFIIVHMLQKYIDIICKSCLLITELLVRAIKL